MFRSLLFGFRLRVLVVYYHVDLGVGIVLSRLAKLTDDKAMFRRKERSDAEKHTCFEPFDSVVMVDLFVRVGDV